jgi:hypothetical protein
MKSEDQDLLIAIALAFIVALLAALAVGRLAQ